MKSCPKGVSPSLFEYVRTAILPLYDSFDKGHGRDHAEYVVDQAMTLCRYYEADPQMVFTAAAYHDTGLCEDRKTHHIVSARIIRSDRELRRWFNEEQIGIIADAAEDHRASGKGAPRSIYGMIVAEADRVIDGETIIRRTVQFGFKHYPDLDREGHIARAIGHLHEKYGRGGYLKLWIPWSENAVRLNALQDTIADPDAILHEVERIYDSLV